MIDSFIARESLVATFASILFGQEILAIHNPKLTIQAPKALSLSACDQFGEFTLAFKAIPCSRAEAWLRFINQRGAATQFIFVPPRQHNHSGSYYLICNGASVGSAEIQMSEPMFPLAAPQNLLSFHKVRANLLLLFEHGCCATTKIALQFNNKLFFGDFQLTDNFTVKISIREVKTVPMEDLPISINIGSLGLSLKQLLKLRPGMEVSFVHNGTFASTLEIGGHPWALGTLHLSSENAQFEIESLPQVLITEEESPCPDQ